MNRLNVNHFQRMCGSSVTSVANVARLLKTHNVPKAWMESKSTLFQVSTL